MSECEHLWYPEGGDPHKMKCISCGTYIYEHRGRLIITKDAEIAALKQENERLKIKLEFNPQRRSMESFAQEVIDLQQTLAAAEARERELREKVEDFLSCERIIRDAGIMDNYTDAARARNRQAAIINEWKQLLGGEK